MFATLLGVRDDYNARVLAEKIATQVLAILFGAIAVLLLLKQVARPLEIPVIVPVPSQPACHTTMVPLWDTDGQRVECPHEGQTMKVENHGDRWFASCLCPAVGASATGAGGAFGTGN